MKTPVFDIGDTLIPSHEHTTRKVKEELAGKNDEVPEFPINEYNIFKPEEIEKWMQEHSLTGNPKEVSCHYVEWEERFLRQKAVPELVRIGDEFGPIGFISDNSIRAKRIYMRIWDEAGLDYRGFVVSEEEGHEKPDPRIFRRFVKERDEPAESFAYFGNYVERDSAAEEIGMNFVWVTQHHIFGSKDWRPSIEKVTLENVREALKEVER